MRLLVNENFHIFLDTLPPSPYAIRRNWESKPIPDLGTIWNPDRFEIIHKRLRTIPLFRFMTTVSSISKNTRSRRKLAFTATYSHLEMFMPQQLRDKAASPFAACLEVDSSALSEEEWLCWLIKNDPEVLVTAWSTQRLPEVFLEKTKRLEYICNLTGSIRRIVPRTYLESGVRVSNWGNSISPIVAEAGLMLILACLRRLVAVNHRMRLTGSWREGTEQVQTLHGKRVGIHGFGMVARELALLLHPFKAHISAYSPGVPEQRFEEFGVKRSPNLESLFAENDIVVELAGLNSTTRGSITASHFKLLKEGDVFVNIGRAEVVREDVLLDVAQEGRIQLGLDVFHEEPLPREHPLRDLPNVTLYPHQAGPTGDSLEFIGRLAARNLKAYVEGEPLEAEIGLSHYDAMT